MVNLITDQQGCQRANHRSIYLRTPVDISHFVDTNRAFAYGDTQTSPSVFVETCRYWPADISSHFLLGPKQLFFTGSPISLWIKVFFFCAQTWAENLLWKIQPREYLIRASAEMYSANIYSGDWVYFSIIFKFSAFFFIRRVFQKLYCLLSWLYNTAQLQDINLTYCHNETRPQTHVKIYLQHIM